MKIRHLIRIAEFGYDQISEDLFKRLSLHSSPEYRDTVLKEHLFSADCFEELPLYLQTTHSDEIALISQSLKKKNCAYFKIIVPPTTYKLQIERHS